MLQHERAPGITRARAWSFRRDLLEAVAAQLVEERTQAHPQQVRRLAAAAARGFERRFQLADYVQVTGAALENGLLHVDLVREIPEAKKPRRIEIAIGGKTRAPAIEGAATEVPAEVQKAA